MHGIFFNPPISSNYLGHQMAEIYRDRVYAPFLEGKSNLTILDVGANIGMTSYYFSQFSKVVYAFEPSLEHFDVLTRMISFNDLQNIIKPVRKAIYIRGGQLPLYHNTNKTMFSLHQAVREESDEKEMVDCIPLEDFFKEKKIKKVDFMKLDVEGSETEIVSSSSFSNVSKQIDTIIIEVHAWSGRHPNQIMEALKNNGYKIETAPSDAKLIVATR